MTFAGRRFRHANPSCENNDLSIADVRKLAVETDALFASSSFLPETVGLEAFLKDKIGAGCLNILYGVRDNDVLIGALVGRTVFDVADLDYIVISPNHYGKKIAASLYADFETECRQLGVTRIVLEVSEKNAQAVTFYRKLNFRKISERAGYYRNGDAALVMEKVI